MPLLLPAPPTLPLPPACARSRRGLSFQSFPTIKLYGAEPIRNPYTGKMMKTPVDYNGPRSARALVEFATSQVCRARVASCREPPSVPPRQQPARSHALSTTTHGPRATPPSAAAPHTGPPPPLGSCRRSSRRSRTRRRPPSRPTAPSRRCCSSRARARQRPCSRRAAPRAVALHCAALHCVSAALRPAPIRPDPLRSAAFALRCAASGTARTRPPLVAVRLSPTRHRPAARGDGRPTPSARESARGRAA